MKETILKWLNFLGVMKFVENPFPFGVGGQFNLVSGVPLTITANVITPLGLVNQAPAGGGLIKTITVPYAGFGGVIFIVAGTTFFTWDATGNIALAGTSTATFRAIPFVFDQTLQKWYPVVVA